MAQTFPLNGKANASIQIHVLHPQPSAQKAKSYLPPDYCSGATEQTGRFSEGFSLRRLQMSEIITKELTIAALEMAITQRRPGPGLLHHSDRGSQYAAHAYRHLLERNNMLCSMSRKGDCWDNAPMESFFGSLKTELDDKIGFETRHDAKRAIFSFVETFYNSRRLHSAIGYRSPAQMEQLAAAA
jgi:transposase InsO family protein